MEARVAVLEAHVEHIKGDLAKLADVPARLAVVEQKIDNLPSKEWVGEKLNKQIMKTAAIVGLITAVGAAANFVPKLLGSG